MAFGRNDPLSCGPSRRSMVETFVGAQTRACWMAARRASSVNVTVPDPCGPAAPDGTGAISRANTSRETANASMRTIHLLGANQSSVAVGDESAFRNRGIVVVGMFLRPLRQLHF